MPPSTPPPVPPSGRGRPRVAGQRRLARRPPDGIGPADAGPADAGPAEPAADPMHVTAPSAAVDPVAEVAATGPAATPPGAPAAAVGSVADRSWVLPAALGSAIALLATLAGVLFAVHHAGQHRLDVADARTAARLAATEGLTAVLSYDYTSFDKDVARGKRYLTPHFAAQYVREQEKVVKETAIKAKAKVAAEISAVGVVDASPHEVHLLAFATQTSTNTTHRTPVADRSRILVTMESVGGRWLISAITPI